jgi:hypothetical protein
MGPPVDSIRSDGEIYFRFDGAVAQARCGRAASHRFVATLHPKREWIKPFCA